jgi:AraC-like DNA-binding protein
MQGFQRLMRSLGHDPEPILLGCGLDPAALSDEDHPVPVQAAFDVMAAAVEQTGLEDLGLRAARFQDISMLGPLALAMQHSPTLQDAMNYLSRYLFVQSPALSMSLHLLAADSAELRYDPSDGGHLRVVPQVFDHGIGLAHVVLRGLAGGQYRLQAVSLRHTPRGTLRPYLGFFDAPVRTGQAHCGLCFSPAILGAPVLSARPALLKVAAEYLNQHFPEPSRIGARVRLALTHSIATSILDKTAVAALLCIHPRTLQRRLQAEGTSFEEIRDQVRRQAAIRYLADGRYPIGRVAGLVGFAEQSALTRFCRKVFQATPREIRSRSLSK